MSYVAPKFISHFFFSSSCGRNREETADVCRLTTQRCRVGNACIEKCNAVATELGGPWGHVPPQNALRYLRVRVTLTLTLTLRHRVSSVLGFLWPDKPLCPPTQQRLPSPMQRSQPSHCRQQIDTAIGLLLNRWQILQRIILAAIVVTFDLVRRFDGNRWRVTCSILSSMFSSRSCTRSKLDSRRPR